MSEERTASYPFEPYRIKMIERIPITSRGDRVRWLEAVGNDPLRLSSDRVTFDLLTDSGTGAMSDVQWAAMFVADEAYAYSRSFRRLEQTVRSLTGIEHVIPAHQGRAAEHVLLSTLVGKGSIVPSNHHFHTTAANIRLLGGIPVDVGVGDPADAPDPDFAGNLDLDQLERVIASAGPTGVPLAMATLTDQNLGGQPVSIENLQAVRALLDRHRIPLYLDAARYAENVYFVKQRSAAWSSSTTAEIARAIFDCATGFLMSAKKDAIASIGGIVATRELSVAAGTVERTLLVEGHPTYGGLAGRDIEAMTTGLTEGLDEANLAHRVGQVRYLAERLAGLGIPLVEPPGGHAVFVRAGDMLHGLAPGAAPGATLLAELYVEAGIRATAVTGPPRGAGQAGPPLVRLCLPWRTYTQSHLDAVVAAFAAILARVDEIRGLRESAPSDPYQSRWLPAG